MKERETQLSRFVVLSLFDITSLTRKRRRIGSIQVVKSILETSAVIMHDYVFFPRQYFIIVD